MAFDRRALKVGLAQLAGKTGALRLLRLGEPRVHIFGYHRVVPDVSTEGEANGKMRQLVISTRSFDLHLDHIARTYDVWALEDAVAYLAGEREKPRREVAVITFDDGYLDIVEHAAPMLAARGLTATMFVTTGVVDTGKSFPHDRLFALLCRARARGVRVLGSAVPDAMLWPLALADQRVARGDILGATDVLLGALGADDLQVVAGALAARVGEPGPDELPAIAGWRDLERLVELGVTLGAHSVRHGLLPLENDERLSEEVAMPRVDIARRIGIPPSVIAYPSGRYDDRVVAATRAAGYAAAVTTEDRRNSKGCDVFRLGRKCVFEDHGLGADGLPSAALVAAQLDGLFSTLGLARAIPGDRDMETPWQ